MNRLDPRTVAVRAGLESDATTGAVVPPIHLSSTYAFPSFGVKGKYDYSRSGNPTRDLGRRCGNLRAEQVRLSPLQAWPRSP